MHMYIYNLYIYTHTYNLHVYITYIVFFIEIKKTTKNHTNN